MNLRTALCPLLSALSVVFLAVQAPVLGQGAAAAAPPAAPKFKGKAPVSNDIIKVKLPRAQETQLSNGAYLMVLEDHRVPSVRFEIIMIGAGGYYDPPGMPGLADTTASLMDEGTTTRSSEQIAQALDTMAASVSVSANEGSQIATVTGSALTDQFDAVLALASDVLLNPSFPEKEIGLYKVRARAGLEEQRSDPDFLRQERYSKAVLRLASGVERGSDARVARENEPRYARQFSQEQLRARPRDHRRVGRHHAGRSAREIRSRAEGMGQERDAVARRDRSTRPRGPENRARQSLGIGADGPDGRGTGDLAHRSRLRRDGRHESDLGGSNGRLYRELRERKGYTYGVYSNTRSLRYRGDWRAQMDVRTDVTEPALRDLLSEINKMRDEPVPLDEFRDANAR
jgi:zinc protease